MTRKSLVVPEPVPAGGRIAVVAPAGPMLPDRVEPGLAPLREAGFELVVRDDIARGQGTYLAGSDEERAAELAGALLDPEIDGIVCIRGGYGSMRILPLLAERLAGADVRPRRIAGFSDITALHAWAYSILGWCSLHTAMPFNFARPAPGVRESAEGLVVSLQQDIQSGAASSTLVPAVTGCATGLLWGGNLSLIAALYRSAWLPSLEDVILFVEDVGESRYRLDRLVMTLELKGAAKEVAGVVIGGVTGGGSTPDDDAAWLASEFARWQVPVAWGCDAGHRLPNRPLWFGWRHELDVRAGLLRRLSPDS